MADQEVADPRLCLVYEESLRTLQDQQQALNNPRSRAGQLLTAASVIEAFLVGSPSGVSVPRLALLPGSVLRPSSWSR